MNPTSDTTWPDFVQPGAYVRVTDGTFAIEGTVTEIDYDGELLFRTSRSPYSSGAYPSAFTATLADPPLPVEPGYYLDKHSCLWKIEASGEAPRRFSEINGLAMPDKLLAEAAGPFTRLVKEAGA